MPRADSPYNTAYVRARARLLGFPCHICLGPGANSADHVPALYEHRHVNGSGCCVLKPAHLSCNIEHSGGWKASNRARRARRVR